MATREREWTGPPRLVLMCRRNPDTRHTKRGKGATQEAEQGRTVQEAMQRGLRQLSTVVSLADTGMPLLDAIARRNDEHLIVSHVELMVPVLCTRVDAHDKTVCDAPGCASAPADTFHAVVFSAKDGCEQDGSDAPGVYARTDGRFLRRWNFYAIDCTEEEAYRVRQYLYAAMGATYRRPVAKEFAWGFFVGALVRQPSRAHDSIHAPSVHCEHCKAADAEYERTGALESQPGAAGRNAHAIARAFREQCALKTDCATPAPAFLPHDANAKRERLATLVATEQLYNVMVPPKRIAADDAHEWPTGPEGYEARLRSYIHDKLAAMLPATLAYERKKEDWDAQVNRFVQAFPRMDRVAARAEVNRLRGEEPTPLDLYQRAAMNTPGLYPATGLCPDVGLCPEVPMTCSELVGSALIYAGLATHSAMSEMAHLNPSMSTPNVVYSVMLKQNSLRPCTRCDFADTWPLEMANARHKTPLERIEQTLDAKGRE